MASINEILGKNIDSVKALKAEIKSLQDSLVGLDSESQEYKDTSLKLIAAQEELTKVTRAGKQENDAAKDSLVGMRQEYKALYDQYKLLTEEQRNSDFGKNMAESLETLSNKINDTQKGVGDFRGNVGRYTQSIEEAFSKMGMSIGALKGPLNIATNGAKGLNDVFKLIAKHPIMAILTVLLAIFMKVADSIKKNEELTNRLKEAMSAFKPVLDFVANAFDFLASVLVKTIEGLSKVGEKILSIIPGYKEAAASHKELAKATNELTKAQREANVENSKKEAEIERLREEASATDDVVEKKKLLEEAKAMQAEIDQKNIELAQEELRILEEYGEKTANSAEENEKLAAAQKKVNDAVAQGERNMRMYNKQLDQVENKTKSAGGAGKNWREEAKKLYEETLEYNKDEITKLTEKYEKEKKLLEKYHYDTKLLTKKYNEEVGKLQVESINRQLSERKSLYENSKRTDELLNEFLTPLRREEKKLEDFEKNTTRRFNKFMDTYNDFIIKVKEKSESLDFGLSNISLDTIDLTDFDAVLNKLKDKLQGFTNAGWGDATLNRMREAIKEMTSLGKKGWAELTAPMQDAINALDVYDGISERSFENIQLNFEALGKKIRETVNDTTADMHIDEKVVSEYAKILEEEMNLLRGGFDEYDFNELAAMNTYSYLEAQRNALQEELTNFQGTQEKKLELMQQYYEVLHEMRENDWADERLNAERNASIWEASFDRFNAVAAAYDSIIDTIKSYMQAEVDSGKLTKKEADRKKKTMENLEKVQVAVAVANIAANTAAGVMDVWRGYASELPVNAQTAAASGPAAAATKAALDAKSLAAAIIRTSTLAVQGTSQIAAAIGGYIVKSNASASESAGGGSTGVGVTPAVINSAPYEYTRTIQTEGDVDMLNERPVIVKVVDIEDALNARDVRVSESSF